MPFDGLSPERVILKLQRHRRLEIGPGPRRIEGFESLHVVGGTNVDYVWNAAITWKRSVLHRSADMIMVGSIWGWLGSSSR